MCALGTAASRLSCVARRSHIVQYARSSRLALATRGIDTGGSWCDEGFHHSLLEPKSKSKSTLTGRPSLSLPGGGFCSRGGPPVPARGGKRAAVWPDEFRVSCCVEFDAEPLLVHRPEMAAAQQYEIAEHRTAAVGPVPHVMRVAAAVLATRKPALPVARRQRPAQGRRNGPRPAADVQDLAAGTVLHLHQCRVAGQPPGGLLRNADPPCLFERRLAAGAAECAPGQGCDVRWLPRARRAVLAGLRGPVPTRLDETFTAAGVPAGTPGPPTLSPELPAAPADVPAGTSWDCRRSFFAIHSLFA